MTPRTASLLAASAVFLIASVAEAGGASSGGGGGGSGPNGFDYNAFAAAIALHESGGDYGIVNSIGYLGKYQVGAAAMVDLGYLDLAVFRRYGDNAAFRDPAAWKPPYTRSGFLADHAEQERAMSRLTAINRSRLRGSGVLTDRSTAVEQGAWLAVAHGLGAGAASSYFRRGEAKPDGYGTTAAQIYRIGAYSQKHPYVLTSATVIPVRNGVIV
jgi:hypothetical protein